MNIPTWICIVIIAAAFLVAGYIDTHEEFITHGAVMLAGE